MQVYLCEKVMNKIYQSLVKNFAEVAQLLPMKANTHSLLRYVPLRARGPV